MATDTSPTAAPPSVAMTAWYLRFRYLVPACLLLIVILASLSSTTQDDPHKSHVSRSDFEAAGKTWPLTVSSGELECTKERWILFTPDGTVDNHSVNGLAKGTGVFSPLEDIWAPDPHVAGLRVDAEDLTDAGLELC